MTPQEKLEQAAEEYVFPREGWSPAELEIFIAGGLKGMEIQKEIDAPKWIDVKDRVPENSNSVLVWCENKWSVACYFRHKEYVDYPGDELDDDQIDNMFDSDGKTETYWLKEGWYESIEDRYGDFFFWQRIVTHWMPLPEPPIV